jgi:hypothetical protein
MKTAQAPSPQSGDIKVVVNHDGQPLTHDFDVFEWETYLGNDELVSSDLPIAKLVTPHANVYVTFAEEDDMVDLILALEVIKVGDGIIGVQIVEFPDSIAGRPAHRSSLTERMEEQRTVETSEVTWLHGAQGTVAFYVQGTKGDLHLCDIAYAEIDSIEVKGQRVVMLTRGEYKRVTIWTASDECATELADRLRATSVPAIVIEDWFTPILLMEPEDKSVPAKLYQHWIKWWKPEKFLAEHDVKVEPLRGTGFACFISNSTPDKLWKYVELIERIEFGDASGPTEPHPGGGQ